jgi:hypothetical protein
MMLNLWHFRGLGLFPKYLSVRTCSLRDHPRKQCNHEGGLGRPWSINWRNMGCSLLRRCAVNGGWGIVLALLRVGANFVSHCNTLNLGV